MQHVLVIGGNRFVGRYLAWRLLAGGHRVTLLNRGQLADPFGDRVERLTCDRTSSEFEQVLRGRRFDAVVDFAAFTGEDGERAAALFAERAGHYVMISTGQVYLVRAGCPQPSRETDYEGALLPRPDAPADVKDWEYGIGKREAEDAIARAANRGLRATRIRIPMVNGPLDHFRRIERYLWRIVDGGPVILPDGGRHQVRHVNGWDVAGVVADVLGRERAFGQAYNLAQDETPTLAALVGMLCTLLGSPAPLLSVPTRALCDAGLDPVVLSPFSGKWMSCLDPSRARSELGFSHTPLPQVLAAIVSDFVSRTRAAAPPGYDRRADELRLAEQWG